MLSSGFKSFELKLVRTANSRLLHEDKHKHSYNRFRQMGAEDLEEYPKNTRTSHFHSLSVKHIVSNFWLKPRNFLLIPVVKEVKLEGNCELFFFFIFHS